MALDRSGRSDFNFEEKRQFGGHVGGYAGHSAT